MGDFVSNYNINDFQLDSLVSADLEPRDEGSLLQFRSSRQNDQKRNRRRYSRFQINNNAYLRVDGTLFPSKVRNISLGGLCLGQSIPAIERSGTCHLGIEIETEDGNSFVLVLKGFCLNPGPGASGTRIMFIDLKDDELHHLKRYLLKLSNKVPIKIAS